MNRSPVALIVLIRFRPLFTSQFFTFAVQDYCSINFWKHAAILTHASNHQSETYFFHLLAQSYCLFIWIGHKFERCGSVRFNEFNSYKSASIQKIMNSEKFCSQVLSAASHSHFENTTPVVTCLVVRTHNSNRVVVSSPI